MDENKFIEKVTQEFEAEMDSIPMNNDLLQKIKSENQKEKSFLPVWFKSPFWNYGFGLVALLFAVLFFLKPTKTRELMVYIDSPNQIITDTVYLKDTVYIEKQIGKNNIIPLVSNQSSRKKKRQKQRTNSYTFDEQYFDAEQLQEQQKKVGKSSEESNELAHFLGVNI